MKTLRNLLDSLLTPTYQLYACPYDGITVDHYGRLNPAIIDYCFRSGAVLEKADGNWPWRYYASIKGPDGTPIIKLWWGPNPLYKGVAQSRIRVNSSTGGLSAGQYAAILTLLCGSEESVENVRVVRMDQKIDIPDTTVDDVDRHILVGYARRRRRIFDMVAVNSRRGTCQFVVYDVGAKRGEGPGRLIRLEYRQRFKRFEDRPLFWDMMAGECLDNNLFKRVSLANTDILDKRARPAKLVAAVGATGALMSLDQRQRQSFKRQVVESVPPHVILADAFIQSAEEWHSTLEDLGEWLVQVNPYLVRAAQLPEHLRPSEPSVHGEPEEITGALTDTSFGQHTHQAALARTSEQENTRNVTAPDTVGLFRSSNLGRHGVPRPVPFNLIGTGDSAAKPPGRTMLQITRWHAHKDFYTLFKLNRVRPYRASPESLAGLPPGPNGRKPGTFRRQFQDSRTRTLAPFGAPPCWRPRRLRLAATALSGSVRTYMHLN